MVSRGGVSLGEGEVVRWRYRGVKMVRRLEGYLDGVIEGLRW